MFLFCETGTKAMQQLWRSFFQTSVLRDFYFTKFMFGISSDKWQSCSECVCFNQRFDYTCIVILRHLTFWSTSNNSKWHRCVFSRSDCLLFYALEICYILDRRFFVFLIKFESIQHLTKLSVKNTIVSDKSCFTEVM